MTAVGDLIAGRYRLVSRIGRGSMGVVWQARDERLDRTVAIKQLVVDETADAKTAQQAVQRAVREGRVAARVRHPHAITVHDSIEHEGRPCLVLEYLPSKSLAILLAEQGTMSPQQVAAIGMQVASALAAAHVEGIVHRDVTPGNVLIASDGTAKIADFGISRALGEGMVTGGGFIAGTPAFLAPEVAAGGEAVFASDVFALGATMYAAVEGQPPFGRDENPYAVLQRAARGEIVAPPYLAGPLTDVLSKMLRPDPSMRPRMAEVAEALVAVAEGRPAPVPREPTLLLRPKAHRPTGRALVAGASGVALLAVGVLIGVLVNRDSTTTTAAPASSASAPAASPSLSPSTTSASPSPSHGCTAEYTVTNSWPDGYQVEVVVRDQNGQGLDGWTVSWRLPSGQSINNLWNGSVSRTENTVTVRNAGYNAVLSANSATTFGFIATTSGGEPGRPDVSCTAS